MGSNPIPEQGSGVSTNCTKWGPFALSDKELHRNTLIFAAIVIVALILWAYLHDKIATALSPAVQPGVNAAGPVSFDIAGQPQSYGPVTFPQAIYNIPAAPPNGQYSPSSCECGCNGGNSGTVTYSFPDVSSLFNQLQLANNAALTNSINMATGALAYSEQVFVTNDSPTLFS